MNLEQSYVYTRTYYMHVITQVRARHHINNNNNNNLNK